MEFPIKKPGDYKMRNEYMATITAISKDGSFLHGHYKNANSWQTKDIWLTDGKNAGTKDSWLDIVSDWPVEPERTFSQWGPRNITIGALVKFKPGSGSTLVSAITGYDDKGIYFLGSPPGPYAFMYCLRDLLYSLDHGKTWSRCGIEE